MRTFTFFSTFSIALLTIGQSVALPTAEGAAELIPGPGLPSLASLGLTTADLDKPIPEENFAALRNLTDVESRSLSKRFNNRCDSTGRVNRDNAIRCYNYLNGLGRTMCRVPDNAGGAGNINFCHIGDAYVTGSCLPGSCPVASYCSDVALGALWIINNCNANNYVRGAAAANGNGDLIVGIQSWSA